MRRARLRPASLALAPLLLLASCGQKGPLYMPDAGGEVITRPMAPVATDAAPTAPADGPAATAAAPEVGAPDAAKDPTPPARR
jgi:predicted small lipoprotein YifL